MKINLKYSTLLVVLACALCTTRSSASQIGYVSGPYPWGINPAPEMNSAFGAGNWDNLDFTAGAGVFSGRSFLYIDGGDGAGTNFGSFVTGNMAAMQNWVSAGGSIFLNAARWNTGTTLNVGFGNSLYLAGGYANASSTGAATGLHPIFDGTTGTGWGGSYFSHDEVLGPGTVLIKNSFGNAVLIEETYGAGHVFIGSMTDPAFQSPGSAAFNLRVNILKYGASQVGTVPDGGTTAVLLGMAMTGMVWVRRKLS